MEIVISLSLSLSLSIFQLKKSPILPLKVKIYPRISSTTHELVI